MLTAENHLKRADILTGKKERSHCGGRPAVMANMSHDQLKLLLKVNPMSQ
jgi:hypothetical protein